MLTSLANLNPAATRICDKVKTHLWVLFNNTAHLVKRVERIKIVNAERNMSVFSTPLS